MKTLKIIPAYGEQDIFCVVEVEYPESKDGGYVAPIYGKGSVFSGTSAQCRKFVADAKASA